MTVAEGKPPDLVAFAEGCRGIKEKGKFPGRIAKPL